jgi:hypothetical protein
MFVEQLRRAVEASPRVELGKVSGLLWRAYAAGHVTESEASALSEAIELKRAIPAPQKPAQRRFGSRPRTAASLERRRRWAASGALPPALASRFTTAENAVLAVVSAEVRRHGACTLTVGHIAALAGVSETTVRNAVREARALSLVQVEERRISAWRNKPNRITVTSREWLTWLRLRTKGGGCTLAKPTPTQENNRPASVQRKRAWAAEGQGAKPGVSWRDTR